MRWRGELSATRPSGKTQYKGRLAQQPVRFTLEALANLYAAALDDVVLNGHIDAQ